MSTNEVCPGDKHEEESRFHPFSGQIVWSILNTNDEFIQIFQLISTVRRNGKAQSAVLVMPDYPYTRQDKSHARRECISARLVGDLPEAPGLDHVITMTLHSEQIEGFFRSVDPLKEVPLMADYFSNRFEALCREISVDADLENFVVMAPRTKEGCGTPRSSEETCPDGPGKWPLRCSRGTGGPCTRRTCADEQMRRKVSIISIVPYLGEAIRRDIRGDTIREMIRGTNIRDCTSRSTAPAPDRKPPRDKHPIPSLPRGPTPACISAFAFNGFPQPSLEDPSFSMC